MSIEADSQLLEPGNLIILFELDATEIGGDIALFHGYNQSGDIVWQGRAFKPWPIEAEGFEITGEAQQPAPTLRVGNVDGSISALANYLGDLLGAKLIRHRTLSKYLDAVNFPDGNPSASPDQHYPSDVFYIEQKLSSDREVVEFMMKSSLDLSDVFLPRRVITPGLCGWRYRDANCAYSGPAVATDKDEPTTNPALDQCSLSVSGCKLRFGEHGILNFGGFPGASLGR